MPKIRGAKPKPTALKRLAGNPGKRPLNDREPVVSAGVPECPNFLNEVARVEWERVVPILSEAGTITELELAALANYCFWWEAFDEAVRYLNEHGKMTKSKQGQEYQSPYMSQAAQAAKQVHTWGTELGLTPSSRTRIKTVEPSADSDPLTALLRQASGRN